MAVDTSRGSELAKDTVAYTYDSGGRLAKLSWPRGDTIRYFYKTDGDLDSVAAKWKAASISQQKVFKFQWDSLGRRRQIQYPHYGMTATYHYDALGTLRKLLSINPAGSDTNRFNFTFTQDSVDVTGRPLHQLVTCDSFTPPTTLIGAPCGGWLPSETRTRYNRLGALVAQYQQNLATPAAVIDTFYYDQSGNRLNDIQPQSGGFSHRMTYPSLSNRVSGRVDSVWTTHATTVWKYVHNLAGSRETDSASGFAQVQHQYDGAERMVGSAMRGTPVDTEPNSCRYDPNGRMVEACGGTVVRLLGDDAVRDANGDWWYVQAPGLDEPILVVKHDVHDSTEVWLQVVSDGNGQLVAIADSLGHLDSVYAGSENFSPGPWGTSGITSRQQTFGPRRWTTQVLGDVSTFRTREYDPDTGKWLQEDPAGLGGGVNLYEYNGNNPASFSDPFGLCNESDPDCKSIGQRVVDAVTGFVNSVAGQAAAAAAGGIKAIGDMLGAVVPGVGLASEAVTGINGQGGQMSAGGRVAALAGAAAEIAGATGDAGRLTTGEASDLAKYLGYTTRVKDPPFNSMGQAVFSNGRNMISPDVTSHAGGVWKMFSRSGERAGTIDALLNRIGN